MSCRHRSAAPCQKSGGTEWGAVGVTVCETMLAAADLSLPWCLLQSMQVAARRFKTPHHYKALNLTMTASEADIRK